MTRWSGETGATAVEYGLLAGAIGIVFVVGGPWLADAFLALLDVILDTTPGVVG